MVRNMSRNKKNGGNLSAKRAPIIAMIGCGAISEIFYLPALKKYPDVLEKLILVDPNEERIQKLANDFNIRNIFMDYHDILRNDLDGVIITAPNQFHYTISMEFLNERIPILCEKPLAVTADKAKGMVTRAKANNVNLLTNYQRRLYASYGKVKELLDKRIFGEPLFFHYSEGQKYSWPIVSGSRFDTKISKRGVLLDRGAHVLDVACWWLGGKPNLISSQNDSFGGCEAVAHIEFEHKLCKGEIKLSLLGNLPCIFRVECENGTIEGDIYDHQNFVLHEKGKKRRIVQTQSSEKKYTDFGKTIVSNFLGVICNEQKPLIQGSEVLESIEWIDECYEAATRFKMPWYEIAEIKNG